MSRSWLGTTWPITEKYFTADRGVFGCRPVETVGAPNAVVSKCQQTKAGAIGRRGLSAVMGGRNTVVVIDAAAWGGRLWEPGSGCQQQRVGWDGSRGSDGGGWGTKGRGWDVSSNVSVGAVIVAQMGGVGHKGLQSRWHDIR